MTPDEIIELVSSCLSLNSDDVKNSKKRDEHIVQGRHISMYLIRNKLKLSSSVIGGIFTKDHTSVLYAFRAVSDRMSIDSEFREKIDHLSDLISMDAKFLGDQINRYLKKLLDTGKKVNSGEWQSTKVDQPMVEIMNVNFQGDIPVGKNELQRQCQPDLPWAEEHFIERVYGEPLNPGVQYLNWPYYKPGSFKEVEGAKFSHTYMERFHPLMAGDNPPNKGIRFNYGGLFDIIERLKKNPGTRQAYLSIWHPEDQSNNGVRIPCTLGYHFMIRDNKLHATYLIRSCDAIRHFRNDIYMASRLVQYVVEKLQINGLKPGTLNTWIGSFHCFESDIYTLRKRIRNGSN